MGGIRYSEFRDFLFRNGKEVVNVEGQNIVVRALVASVALLGTSFGGGYAQADDVPNSVVHSASVSRVADRGSVGQFKALESASQMIGIPAALPWYCAFFPRFRSCQNAMLGI